MLGRTASSCFMHSRKRLAWQQLPNMNSMVQAYAKHRAEMWDSIGKELSLSCDEVETLFLYLWRQDPTLFHKNQSKSASPDTQIKQEPE
ncbi:hypothetical protein GGR50DRAFT_230548 [Xylaria sp. CBS 124048]|nr:hypothetical protein GGR50DRAFT_230548 [Xylaria sp. CBS 124048]